MRILMLALLILLLSPCPACGVRGGSPEPCTVYACGSYRMNGEWLTDLHQETWRVGPNGERENFTVQDIPAILRVASTGCGATVAGFIPALYTDDELYIEADFPVFFDDEGAYGEEWSWRGVCNMQGGCLLDGEVTVYAGGSSFTERGVFMFTNLRRRGSDE